MPLIIFCWVKRKQDSIKRHETYREGETVKTFIGLCIPEGSEFGEALTFSKALQ